MAPLRQENPAGQVDSTVDISHMSLEFISEILT